ncbi:MAG TPA: hypothetical protein VEB86_02100, partial [Chryseosolibacter sp.]|nr:hypothetical protein [Chryseosolibacter sp.]
MILITTLSFSQVRSTLSNNNTRVVGDKGIFGAPGPDKTLIVTIDRQQAIRETEAEEQSGAGLPYRFGKGVAINQTQDNSGTWYETENGRVWKLRIKSPSAYSLNLSFSRLFLSGASELYLYNREGTMVYGPITAAAISSAGFNTDLIKGDEITLELFEPTAELNKNVLELSKVVHGFRDMFKQANFGDSNVQGCQHDASCSSGLNPQSNGVAMILLASQERICSGSLLNNACRDFTPNILTAFHCVDIGNTSTGNACNDPEVFNGVLSTQEITNAENWVFRFQYKRNACDSGTEPTSYVTFQRGAIFRSAFFNTDMALFQMRDNPALVAPNSGIRYLG